MDWKKYVVENYLGKKGGDYYEFKLEIKRKIFEELTSGEQDKITKAAKVLIHLDNLDFSQDELNFIKEKCKKLPISKGKMIRDYREDVNAALMMLEHFVNDGECKCKIYQKWIQFSPEREIEMGFLILENKPRTNKEKYQEEFDLKCLNCGIKWQSNVNHGYHYLWYEWEKR